MTDFSENPVIDAHCHPFLPEKESRPFEAYLTLSDLPQRHEDLTSTMLYRQVMRELGRLLRLKGETRIIEERQRRIKSDPSSYINTLFDDAGIEALLVDSGYPFKEFTGYEIDLGDFSEMIGREAHEIFRLEVAVYGLLKGLVPFDDAAEDMRTQVREAVRGGVVALKSIVAYRTGLEYRAWDEGTAKRSWEEMTGLVRDGRKPGEVLAVRNERNKSIYDTFLMVGIEEAGVSTCRSRSTQAWGTAPRWTSDSPTPRNSTTCCKTREHARRSSSSPTEATPTSRRRPSS